MLAWRHTLVCRKPEATARQRPELDVASGDIELWTGMIASRAAIVAEVPYIRRRVQIRRAAANAVLRVRGMLKGGSRMSRVVETEPESTLATVGEVGYDRIVGVHDEKRLLREASYSGTPPLGHELELAVAVELIAEKIREGNDAWLGASNRLGKRTFVDLEESELRIPRGDERGRDPRQEIGT